MDESVNGLKKKAPPIKVELRESKVNSSANGPIKTSREVRKSGISDVSTSTTRFMQLSPSQHLVEISDHIISIAELQPR